MIKSWGALKKESLSIKDTLKLIAKQTLGRLCIYKLTEKPIFIFANRRGGSTLAMEMIYSQPGVDCVGKPRNLWRYHPYFNWLPHPPCG